MTIGMMQASLPPATMTLARPMRMRSAASPSELLLVAQAER